ncbi:MAG TPA: HlyD family secretion protein [Candidatus Binataceae bacterium]|nr:HlyD family secretion protein [Candidatus Binataceae bacterium]HVC45039.1 HlyD family secretion protein [Candidatus Binataceae bacterium]
MRASLFRRVLLVIGIVAIAAAVVPALRFYHYFETHVSTDDAYVDGTVALVSSRVAGTVSSLYVEDNWTVTEGEVLLTLDPRDYEVRVEQARAQLARAHQSVDEMYAGVDEARSGVRLAQTQLHQAQIDWERAKALKSQGIISAEYYDQAQTAVRVATANSALADHELAQSKAALGEEVDHTDHSRYDRPIVKQAEAALETAKLDLGYTKIFAPFAGIVTHKTVHIGHRVQVGEPLMAIVPLKHLYITANYKETQLTDVRVGQHATVEADIYPGYVYQGHVDSISMGTGAAFSLLPPENATGNWVKVVQRVPVKIVLDQDIPADKPLRLGLSVEVAINVGNTHGSLLSSMVQRHFEHNGATTPNESLKVQPMPAPEPHGQPPPAEQHRQFLHRLFHRRQ